MRDDDSKLIWESFNSGGDWSSEGYDELDFEKIPVDELKQLTPGEAKKAIGKLNQIDIAIQKGTDRMFNDEERARRNNISGRIKALQDIITPPAPPESAEEIEARKDKRRSDREVFMNQRRMLQPTKQKFREDGTFEEIAKSIPEWVTSQTRYQFMGKQPGDGDIPANLQRMIVMDYLENEKLPSEEDIDDMIEHLVMINDLDKPSD